MYHSARWQNIDRLGLCIKGRLKVLDGGSFRIDVLMTETAAQQRYVCCLNCHPAFIRSEGLRNLVDTIQTNIDSTALTEAFRASGIFGASPLWKEITAANLCNCSCALPSFIPGLATAHNPQTVINLDL